MSDIIWALIDGKPEIVTLAGETDPILATDETLEWITIMIDEWHHDANYFVAPR